MASATKTEAAERGISARVQVMDAEHLDFADETFDRVLCGFGIAFSGPIARIKGIPYRRRRDPKENVSISLRVGEWELILARAKDGVQKRQGRRRPRETRADQVRRNAIIDWAKDRKKELIGAGRRATGANSAEDQAAEEARVFARQRYSKNWSANTIKRWMQTAR
jgi:hypothetical protein